MATTLDSVARNAACDAVVDQLDGGTLEIQTSGAAVLATFTLPSPAFGSAASGVATANAISDVTATADGTAAQFALKTSGGATRVSGAVTVTGGGGEIELSNTSITTGDTVSITSLTHTQPA